MSVYKTRRRIRGNNNSYHIVYEETSTDQVKHTDGTTAAGHIDSRVSSSSGAHGFRYNSEADALEVYNESTGQWVQAVSSVGGATVGNVSNISTLPGNGSVYVKWTDPEDGGDLTPATWGGTLLVRKTGSTPENRMDGTIVVDSKVRNAYAESYFCDTGLTNGTVYYYKFFPYTTSNAYTNSPENAFTATPAASALNDVPWPYIKTISDNGLGADFWDIGDIKTILIHGPVGSSSFTNLSVSAFILSFSHNTAKEGDNRIHFQIGKINGVSVGLCDGMYGEIVSNYSAFNMNMSDSNAGGWENSAMRKTLLGNSNTPSSPLAMSLMSALPSDLRGVMKAVTKYTDNTGGGADASSYVTSTVEYLSLPSEYEVYGLRYLANSAEQTMQEQYEYYKTGNSKIAYHHSETSRSVAQWLRSPTAQHDELFCSVYNDGRAMSDSASVSRAIRPIFYV